MKFSLLVVALCALVASARKPHILLVLVDDLGYTDTGFMNAEYETKTIDNLAKSGVTLNNYYVEPTCTPTRSAILTGRFSFRNGLQSLQTIPPAGTGHLPLNTTTVPEALKKSGYQTYMLGKWHLGYASWQYTPTSRGFDEFVGFMQGAQYYYKHTIPGGFKHPNIIGYDFWHNKQVLNVTGNYSTDVLTSEAVRMIDNHDNNVPMFMYYSVQTVHAPIELPPDNQNFTDACRHVVPEMRRTYCLKMQALDASLDTVVTALKEKEMWNNTIMFLTTDNGGMVDVGAAPFNNNFTTSIGSNFPLRAGKATMFEGGVKGVAFMCGGSGLINNFRGEESNSLHHVVDIGATVMTVGGASLPQNLDGKTLLVESEVDNSVALSDGHAHIPLHIERAGMLSALRDGDMKLIIGNQPYDGYYQPGKDIIEPTTNCTHQCLFNITADPTEKTDVLRQHPEIAIRMRKTILDYVTSGDYRHEEDQVFHEEGSADRHGGVWTPWLA